MSLIFHEKKRRGRVGNVISGRVWQESSQVSGGLVACSHGVCESPKKGAWGTGGGEREESYLLRDAEFLILGGWSSQRDLIKSRFYCYLFIYDLF